MAKKSTTKSPVTEADDKAGDDSATSFLAATTDTASPSTPPIPNDTTATDKPPTAAAEIHLPDDASRAETPALVATAIAGAPDKPGQPIKADRPAAGGAAAAIERARRNPLLNWLSGRAAMIAIAAGIGALVGSTLSNGISYTIASAGGGNDDALRASVGRLTAEIASLKALIAGGDKAAAIVLSGTPRLLGGADSAKAPAPKLAGVEDASSPVSPEITGSIAPQSAPIAEGWTLWRVSNGRALVEGASGYYEVAPGSRLPGLGMVQRIVLRGDAWSVETRNGVILPRD